MIRKVTEKVCSLLRLDMPKIDNDESHFTSETMIAQVTSDGKHIHIRKGASEPDVIFAIAHELRHIWQIENDEEFYFGDYHDVSEIGVNAYNRQAAEIDANAFATLTLVIMMDLQPLLGNLPDEIKGMIWKRTQEILQLMDEEAK